jgi:hypothetical protein
LGAKRCPPAIHSGARAAIQGAEPKETAMKTLRVLDSSGDRVVEFDDTAALAECREHARALFERLLAGGSTAFKVNRGDGRPDEKVTDFAGLENETIVVPRVVGG